MLSMSHTGNFSLSQDQPAMSLSALKQVTGVGASIQGRCTAKHLRQKIHAEGGDLRSTPALTSRLWHSLGPRAKMVKHDAFQPRYCVSESAHVHPVTTLLSVFQRVPMCAQLPRCRGPSQLYQFSSQLLR